MRYRHLLINIFLFVILGILMMSLTSSLGVTPGAHTFDFSPGAKKNINVKIINSEYKDMNLRIAVRGEHNESIIIREDKLKISANEKERDYSFDLLMPEHMQPGTHIIEVAFFQQADDVDESSASLGSSLAVATQVVIYSAYPGKYIDAELNVLGNEEKKSFVISAVNRGKEKIERIEGKIHLYDENENNIGKLNTNSVSLDKGEKKEVSADWDVNVPEGKYFARAVVYFDGKEILLEKEFTVGEMILDLKRIYVEDFKLGEVAKFNLVVENKWNEPITKAYAEMRVYDENNNELGNIKSATYDIPAKMQTIMNYYWDTKEIEKGMYNANVILYYLGKKTQQDLKLDIKEDSIEVIGLGYVVSSEETTDSGIVTTLFIIIGFLILLNIVWFLVLRKRVMKK